MAEEWKLPEPPPTQIIFVQYETGNQQLLEEAHCVVKQVDSLYANGDVRCVAIPSRINVTTITADKYKTPVMKEPIVWDLATLQEAASMGLHSFAFFSRIHSNNSLDFGQKTRILRLLQLEDKVIKATKADKPIIAKDEANASN